jgi:hypothetical protein
VAVPFDTPVSAIQGIGSASEQLLQRHGIYTVYDLLRAQSPAIHRVVASVASLSDARAWRQMAVLLEVATVTPQWAEALVRGGVRTLDELRHLRSDELKAVFTAARDSHIIADVPTSDQLVAMLTDATLLDYAGAITGTVKDRDGRPIAAATVTAGGAEAVTDARGRFRLRRLRLGRDAILTIAKDSFVTHSETVSPSPTTNVVVAQFTLVRAVRQRPRRSGQPAAALSELRGDRMPPMQGQNVTSHEVPLASLQPQELVVLTEFYANGTDAKIVSKLLEFDGTRFVARWVRLRKSALPDGSSLGDHFIVRPGGFHKVKMNATKLDAYKRYLAARRRRAGQLPGQTPAERYASSAQVLAASRRRR